MENIQEQLKNQYNKSIDFYNKGDYEHYFFHVRKSIELICKFLIFDALKIKGEEDKAPYIISGGYSFSIDNDQKICNLTTKAQSREPEGSFFYSACQIHDVLCFSSSF